MKLVALLVAVLAPAAALAGPPYVTDDPEPVATGHWELYLATQDGGAPGGAAGGTAPHVEVNYGAAPGLQLHAIVPLAWSHTPGSRTEVGLGDIELGAKWRFVEEGDRRPMVGVFPLVELPTGSEARGLGEGRLRVFLPLWLQKSFGPWSTYGGGGWWVETGSPHRAWWLLGWQAQRRVAGWASVGAELFYETAPDAASRASLRFDLGAVLDLTELHHLLLSGGHNLAGEAGWQGYAAYLLTL